MKYLLVLLVVALGLWLLLRPRGGDSPPPAPRTGGRKRDRAPTDEMVACAHCDLRLPRSEALMGPEGRPYCSEAHRLAGPR